MARTRVRYHFEDDSGNRPAHIKATAYVPGTDTPVPGAYDAASGGNAITWPLAANSKGYVTFYLDTAQDVEMVVTDDTNFHLHAVDDRPYVSVTPDLSSAYAPLDARDTSITAFAAGQIVVSGTSLYKVTTAHAAPFDTAKATSVGGGGSSPDATTGVKGLVQLAGDLGGTAASPTVPRLASLADRGAWLTATAYVVGDVVTFSGIRYVARTAHTAGASFTVDWGNAKWTQTSLSNAVTTIGLKRDFGAKGDCRILTDAVVTATTTLTSATGAFTATDQGKTVAIPYANGMAAHITTVASVESSTSLTLTAAPANAVTASRTITDGAMATRAPTLTSATANFTSADLGKKITIPGAGQLQSDGSAPLETRITTVTNSTTVQTQTANIGSAISGKTVTVPGPIVYIGTDDSTALQAAADLGSSTGRPVEVEPGNYLKTAEISVSSKFAWYGHGAGVSIITHAHNDVSGRAAFIQIGGSQLTDVTFRDFEIDCTAAKVATYTTRNKAIYLRPVDRMRIQGMFIHDTSATAIGCDWLRDSYIVNNVIEYGATQYVELGATAGGAGIGLGTGKYTDESVLIAGNSVKNCGDKGIFAESQSSTIRSRGVRIVNNYVYGSRVGIGDYACDSIVIEGNVIEQSQYGLRANFGFVSTLYPENGLMKGNTLRNAGIELLLKTGSYTVEGNVMDGGNFYSNTITAAASGTLETIRFTGNYVRNCNSRGLTIAGTPTTWNRMIVDDNVFMDSPASRSAIYSTATLNVLSVRFNTAYDSRGTKLQTYGLELASGAVTKLIRYGNDFTDNLTGAELLTITPGSTVSSP